MKYIIELSIFHVFLKEVGSYKSRKVTQNNKETVDFRRANSLPYLTRVSTTFLNPAILCSNIEIRPQRILGQWKEHKRRAYNNLCKEPIINTIIRNRERKQR